MKRGAEGERGDLCAQTRRVSLNQLVRWGPRRPRPPPPSPTRGPLHPTHQLSLAAPRGALALRTGRGAPGLAHAPHQPAATALCPLTGEPQVSGPRPHCASSLLRPRSRGCPPAPWGLCLVRSPAPTDPSAGHRSLWNTRLLEPPVLRSCQDAAPSCLPPDAPCRRPLPLSSLRHGPGAVTLPPAVVPRPSPKPPTGRLPHSVPAAVPASCTAVC